MEEKQLALNWYWKDKCGKAVFFNKHMYKEYTLNNYEGNVFLILNESEDFFTLIGNHPF